VIYVNFPVGGFHGWGICGKYIVRELAATEPVCLITDRLDPDLIGGEIEFARFRKLLPQSNEIADLAHQPLLIAIAGPHMGPFRPELKGRRTVGYTFIEETRLTPAAIETARRCYDVIAAGSSWCAQVLKDHGLSDVATAIQGIDPDLFFPREPRRKLFPDHFLVFSGGKFEFRKGQDLVLRAFKVLQDRHRDVLLVSAWYNQWGYSWETMKRSPHIRFAPRSREYFPALNEIFADNGIDPAKTINVPPRPNAVAPGIYRQTDVGIFPNRCEGGTTLVLMEYMACGRPVIATNHTGHADVVNSENALVIESPATTTVPREDGSTAADWPEPNLEQTIEQLEFAYQNRDRTKALAERGAGDLAKLTWGQTAKRFAELLR
jgi:glycosyltransferase involved in cell wall biosynthesis